MHAFVLVDKDAASPLAADLRVRVCDVLRHKGYDVDLFALGAADVMPCTGCLRCHIDRLGTCVDVDGLTPINARIGDADLICFIGPMVFGQMGSTLKNAIDKVQTNRMHTRHSIVFGFSDDARDDEVATFADIVTKHGGAANVVHPRFQARNDVYAARTLADDALIAERLEATL